MKTAKNPFLFAGRRLSLSAWRSPWHARYKRSDPDSLGELDGGWDFSRRVAPMYMGHTVTGSFTITVRDTTAPVISSLAASSATLWPPNHKMVPITVTPVALDAADNATTKTVTVSVPKSQGGK